MQITILLVLHHLVLYNQSVVAADAEGAVGTKGESKRLSLIIWVIQRMPSKLLMSLCTWCHFQLKVAPCDWKWHQVCSDWKWHEARWSLITKASGGYRLNLSLKQPQPCPIGCLVALSLLACLIATKIIFQVLIMYCLINSLGGVGRPPRRCLRGPATGPASARRLGRAAPDRLTKASSATATPAALQSSATATPAEL